MNRTQLYDLQRDSGANFADYSGWEKPTDFGDCLSEYHFVREHMGVVDRSERGKLIVSGTDRYTWLQGMISNDVRVLSEGASAIDACILNATGHLLSDVRVVNRGDNLLLDLDRANVDKIYRLLDGFIITEDVEIVDQSDYLACLSVQGPEASSARLADYLPEGATSVSTDHTGLGGVDMYLKATESVALWHQLVEAGARAVGEEAVETLRIEAGIPKFGVDMDETTIPLECGLESSHISHTKGCYVGQEIIARIVSRGHTNRALSGLLLEGSQLAHRSDKIYLTHGDTDREIGWVTSATHSPLLGKSIALAYLRHEHSEPGTHLRIDRGDAILSAEVCGLPFKPS